ncbi:hypothetical protein C8R46DRAFT_1018535 [Mycena filopes]|nr:hypothetical protein C8R46DRAFT_1018535 [Mycena filopes]
MTLCTNCGFIPGQRTPGDALPNLQDLRRRLSSLDATIAVLTAERQRLQLLSDAVVYPILSLPTEITAEIFVHCCDPSQWAPFKGPLLLAQICRRWREIAIHTPSLWRSVHFTARASVELLKLWLARSGDAPLELMSLSGGAQTQPLNTASLLHTHHWQAVRFGLPYDLYTDMDLGNAPLPILRSISLDIFAGHFGAPPVTGVVTLVNAPMLREAHLRVPPGVRVDLLWSQMTTLTLDDINLAECISTLRSCADLVKLSVHTIGPAPLHTEPVLLPALESLKCRLINVSILEHLTLPHLHTLTLAPTVEPQNALTLKDFIRRSACPLRIFTISCHYLALDTLTTCLAAVSKSVSDLDLGLTSMDLLAALTPMDILPHLKVLRIQGSSPSNTDFQHIIDVLMARLRPSPPRVALDEVTLHFSVQPAPLRDSCMPTASMMAQFRALVADGLKVKFTMSGRHPGPITRVVLHSSTE